MGGVLQITTRMPDKLEVTAKQSVSLQDFSLYGTSKLFHTEVTSASVGDKIGDFSWFVTGNYAHGTTQPLTYVTSSSLYGWPGAYFGNTKFGGPATVLGTTGNLENDQINAKLKLAYDFTPTIRATYTLGFWSNDGTSIPQILCLRRAASLRRGERTGSSAPRRCRASAAAITASRRRCSPMRWR